MVEGWAAQFRARRPRLDQVLADRANNFDLIRLAAAALVIYGHSFFEASGDATADLVQRAFEGAEYAGSVAVCAFFLISGILITASMEKHRSALAFVTLRFARIWPGFAVCAAVLLYAVVPLASGVAPLSRVWLKEASACWRVDALFSVMGGYSSYPVLFFFAGMLLYAFRRSVPTDGLAAAVLAAVAFAVPRPNPLVYPALAYGVLALAAARPLRRLKPRRDLSYGVYIYGAALQQVVATLLPGRSAIVNFAVSLPATLAAASVSAKLVEEPAIAAGRRIARRFAGPDPRPTGGVDRDIERSLP